MTPISALPDIYYAIFGIYEPFLTTMGFIGTLFDPKITHDAQAPWGSRGPPLGPLPRATFVTVVQLANVCGLIGVINIFVLTTARRHLSSNPALQEKIVGSLLIPLLIGDILHAYVTLWALGDQKWEPWNWSPMLWTTLLLGFTLMIPRICWNFGIGRYVDSRDSPAPRKS
ncbi:hypothetical protein BDN71DRAFT_1450966 [Pleurotus eryngii]|uniref:DUF7704 domain-containing protein n=1 Tax=Pleurotus eryngii TaxID=5323 RepID=A0A9P5ZSN1_PLEER|nr:hypothetical protein BDN71DRAFT_1450966 [Pleurotus eryngii]